MENMQLAVHKREFDRVIEEVLEDKKYWHLNKEINQMTQSLLERLRDWLEKILSSRIKDLDQVGALSDILSIVIIVILGIILIALIAFAIHYVYKSINAHKKLDEILGEKITKETTPSTLLNKAGEFEAQGAYRMSIRYGYIGLLLLMHQKGLLYIEKSMTNTEIYESLKKKHYGRLKTFKRLMEVFNYTWYGQNEYSVEDYTRYKENEAMLWNEVSNHEKKYKE